MRLLFTLLFSLIIITGCEESSDPDCDLTCGEFSSCKVVDDEPSCVCNDNYIKNSDNSCVPTCDGMSCGENQHCAINNQVPACVCDDFYRLEGESCLASCQDFECGDNSSCIVSDQNKHQCICDSGYEKEGDLCELVNSPCDSFDCTHLQNSICKIDGEQPVCVCEGDFVTMGDQCVDPRHKKVVANFNRVVEYVRSELNSGDPNDLEITMDAVADLNLELGKSPFSDSVYAVMVAGSAGNSGEINVSDTDLRAMDYVYTVTVYAPAPVDGIDFGLKDVVIEKCDAYCRNTKKNHMYNNFDRAVEYVQSELKKAPAGDPSITNDAVLDLNNELEEEFKKAPLNSWMDAFGLGAPAAGTGQVGLTATDLRSLAPGTTVQIELDHGNFITESQGFISVTVTKE